MHSHSHDQCPGLDSIISASLFLPQDSWGQSSFPCPGLEPVGDVEGAALWRSPSRNVEGCDVPSL